MLGWSLDGTHLVVGLQDGSTIGTGHYLGLYDIDGATAAATRIQPEGISPFHAVYWYPVKEDSSDWDVAGTSTDTPLRIPDNDSGGVASRIPVSPDGNVTQLDVDVHITHTYISDLVVRLQSPSGTVVTLHNRSGGSADDINATYQLTGFNGETMTGDWKLLVSDHYSWDTGTLQEWALRIR